MSKPAPPPARSRFTTKLIEGLKAFSAGLSDQAVIDAGVGLFIIVALAVLLLRDYQRPSIKQLPVGAVATTAIVPPEDVKVEDTAETRRQRDQMAAAVLPVFDFNPRSARDAVISLQELFAAGREAGGDASPDDLHKQIEERVGIALEPEQVAVLARHRFSP